MFRKATNLIMPKESSKGNSQIINFFINSISMMMEQDNDNEKQMISIKLNKMRNATFSKAY